MLELLCQLMGLLAIPKGREVNPARWDDPASVGLGARESQMVIQARLSFSLQPCRQPVTSMADWRNCGASPLFLLKGVEYVSVLLVKPARRV